jgi:hypothetical protein
MTKARDLANVISGSGTLNANVIPALPASKITSGTFADARLSSSSVTQHVDLTALSADNLTSGTVPSARLSLSASDVPDLATSKITSGTFADARLSSSSVTQHVDLSNLNADNLTSGTVPNARYGTPTFSGANLTNLPVTSDFSSGSWTPSFSSGQYNSTGRWQKFGQLVFCQAEIEMVTQPANNNTIVTCGGLPFTCLSTDGGASGRWFPSYGRMDGKGQGSNSQIYVHDNSTSFGFYRIEGWRITQYYNYVGRGGVYNSLFREIRENSDKDWFWLNFFYTASS